MPSDAFERFVALGPNRSYARLAAALGCSKRSVTARARKENWQQRLAGIEEQARTKADQKLAESTAAINDRHLRTLRAVQHKALQALTSSPLGTASQAAATLIAAVRAERAIVAPAGGDGQPAPTHAQLAEAAAAIPQEVVDAALAALRKYEEKQRAAAAAPPPAQPVVPPSLTPRVYAEN